MQFISFVIHNIHKFAVKQMETDKPWIGVHKQKFKCGYIIVYRLCNTLRYLRR
jgi:hypothetical protein